ncbi:hypothetical protein QAD02_007562 [Eretmocerus hayati]|uniref:Uncharacterized protein n=1 Tax=Eretmocerus hayati TaxID=131215 RepID=A0ACC2N402_9HYME|nr:hypothetical protein QAD02_007562 [Eretmocerus hayati]
MMALDDPVVSSSFPPTDPADDSNIPEIMKVPHPVTKGGDSMDKEDIEAPPSSSSLKIHLVSPEFMEVPDSVGVPQASSVEQVQKPRIISNKLLSLYEKFLRYRIPGQAYPFLWRIPESGEDTEMCPNPGGTDLTQPGKPYRLFGRVLTLKRLFKTAVTHQEVLIMYSCRFSYRIEYQEEEEEDPLGPIPKTRWDVLPEEKKSSAIHRQVQVSGVVVDWDPTSQSPRHPLNDEVLEARRLDYEAEVVKLGIHSPWVRAPTTPCHVPKNHCRVASRQLANDDGTLYRHDVKGLFSELEYEHSPDEWRLFIDSNKTSLKGVLLHNGNEKSPMPLYYGPQVKECYENVKIFLNKVNYEEYRWGICGDFKIISMILGLQLGYTRHMCFSCEWNSRSKEEHYVRKGWPPRQVMIPGQGNVQAIPLVDRDKIVLPPLHIKLGIVEHFIKAMNKTGAGVLFLREKFPRLSEAKLKEGVSIGPDIRILMFDSGFDAVLNEVELKSWKSVKNVINNYLGNQVRES